MTIFLFGLPRPYDIKVYIIVCILSFIFSCRTNAKYEDSDNLEDSFSDDLESVMADLNSNIFLRYIVLVSARLIIIFLGCAIE